nr:hypothetical protein [uncultured Mucilaginibacter sp.]
MKYAEWNKLTPEEKSTAHWKHHPRIRVASIFSVLFAIVFFVVLLRIFQNKRVHVNRKPNAMEAFTVSKAIVKNTLKHPAAASFPSNKYKSVIDTAASTYQITSTVNSQDSSGKTLKLNWKLNLAYTGGDWADTTSWRVDGMQISQ